MDGLFLFSNRNETTPSYIKKYHIPFPIAIGSPQGGKRIFLKKCSDFHSAGVNGAAAL